MDLIHLTPVGVVKNAVTEPADDIWGGLVSRVELDMARFGPDALAGLSSFSHVEIVYHFHRAAAAFDETRHPRGRTDWPRVGIFAQRGKDRPNRVGVTVCRLLRVEGTALEVEGLDAINGTPVLDIKPYLREFGPRGEVSQPDWSRELMAGYWGR